MIVSLGNEKNSSAVSSQLFELCEIRQNKLKEICKEFMQERKGFLSQHINQEQKLEQIKKKEHTVNSFVTADVPPVYADKYDIERVVLNILTNSIKYTPNGGEIKIYVGFVYNDAYIKIFDNGIGIPEEDLTRIFERFYRVDKARTREMGGTGLGLSIAKEILEKNNSKIKVEKYPIKYFNYSAIVNYGVEKSTGKYVILLNNDIEILTSDWISIKKIYI